MLTPTRDTVARALELLQGEPGMSLQRFAQKWGADVQGRGGIGRLLHAIQRQGLAVSRGRGAQGRWWTKPQGDALVEVMRRAPETTDPDAFDPILAALPQYAGPPLVAWPGVVPPPPAPPLPPERPLVAWSAGSPGALEQQAREREYEGHMAQHWAMYYPPPPAPPQYVPPPAPRPHVYTEAEIEAALRGCGVVPRPSPAAAPVVQPPPDPRAAVAELVGIMRALRGVDQQLRGVFGGGRQVVDDEPEPTQVEEEPATPGAIPIPGVTLSDGSQAMYAPGLMGAIAANPAIATRVLSAGNELLDAFTSFALERLPALADRKPTPAQQQQHVGEGPRPWPQL